MGNVYMPSLTACEIKVLQAIADDPFNTYEQTAFALLISVNTVKTHMSHVFEKFGVNTRRDAVTVARQEGII